jgi:hypothetical protein
MKIEILKKTKLHENLSPLFESFYAYITDGWTGLVNLINVPQGSKTSKNGHG